MERWHGERGQAASEYVALVALVAVALALAAGLTSGGVGSHVLAGIQRGLCRVTPLHCPPPQPPRADLAACPLERRTRSEDFAATIAVVRLGTRGVLTATRLSDGRVTVSLAHGKALGGEVGLGARLRLGRRSLGEAQSARAGAEWTSGRSWTFSSEPAARRFVETYGRKATLEGKLLDNVRSRCSILCDALGWDPHEELPPPDETFAERGVAAELKAALGTRTDARFDAKALLGRQERRDGSRTWYVKLGATATAALELPGAALSGAAAGDAVLAYELDAAGRPRSLNVALAGELRGRAEIGHAVGPAQASIAGGAGLLVELDATLDLREPANRAAAAGLFHALTDPRALPRAASRLGNRIARHARLDRRIFAATRDTTGIGAGVARGYKLDAGIDATSDHLRLLAAETRLPGLPFLPRDDCRAS